VKLTNIKDCVARGLVKEGEEPIEVAAQRLIADKVTVIHTIGGDDTNTQAAVLSKYILDNYGGKIAVIGMPKTIDNDVIPIKQTFGADTAAEQGALYFSNIVNESTANPRMLILHEVMGRHSGYLTAATAHKYRELLTIQCADFLLEHVFSSTHKSRDVHAVWIPEMSLDIEAEGARLKKIMDIHGNVNVFMSEGSGVNEILAELEANGQAVPRDAFGHVRLDTINPGQYFAKRLAEMIHAEKTLVQKSGYFGRSAPANAFDKELIRKCAEAGVDAAIQGISGCMGEDEEQEGCPIRPCEFERIAGGKHFDYKQEWFLGMLREIGQPV
jgi:pyrophosphate--fructose-6-phosphate 1-phosphotransferase